MMLLYQPKAYYCLLFELKVMPKNNKNPFNDNTCILLKDLDFVAGILIIVKD